MFSTRYYLFLVLLLLPQTVVAQQETNLDEKSTRWLSNRAKVMQKTVDRLDRKLKKKTKKLQNIRVRLESKRIQLDVINAPEPPDVNKNTSETERLRTRIKHKKNQISFQEKRTNILNELLNIRESRRKQVQQALRLLDRFQHALSELTPLMKALKDRVSDETKAPDTMPDTLSWERHAIHQLRSETKRETFLEEKRQGKKTLKTLRRQLESARAKQAGLNERLSNLKQDLEQAGRVDRLRSRYKKMNRKALLGKAQDQLDARTRKLAHLRDQIQQLEQLQERHKRQFRELDQLESPDPAQTGDETEDPDIGTSAREIKLARARMNFRTKRKKKLNAIQATLNKEESILSKATVTRRRIRQSTEELRAIKSVLQKNTGNSDTNLPDGLDLDTLRKTAEQEQRFASRLEELRNTLHEVRNRLKSARSYDRAMAFRLSNYDQLPLSYLRPRARTLRNVVDTLREKLGKLRKKESRHAEKIASLKAKLGTLQEPAPVDTSGDTPVWEKTRLELEAKNEALQVVEQRRKLLENIRSSMEERMKLLRSLRDKGMQLSTVLEALEPVLTELDERLQKGQVNESDLRTEPDMKAYRKEREKLNRQLSEWELALKELPASRQYVETMLENVEDRLTQLRKNLENVKRRREEALKRKKFYREHKGKDAQTLSGLLSRLKENWASKKEDFNSSNTLYQEKLAQLQGVEESIDNLKKPSVDDIEVDEQLELLKQTARELKLTKKRHQFYRKRSELYRDLKEQYESLLQQLDEAVAKRREEFGVLQELKAVISLLLVNNNEEPVSRKIDAGKIQERISYLKKRGASFIDRQRQYKNRLKETEKALDADRKMVKKLENDIDRLEKKLNSDREWANWTREVQKLETPALIDRFRQAGQDVEEARNKVASIRKETNELKQNLERSRNELDEIVNPQIRKARLKRPERRDLFLEKLKQFPDSRLDVRSERQSDEKRPLSLDLPETLDGWQNHYSEHRRRWSGQLQYLKQREGMRATTLERMKTYRSKLQTLRESVDELLKRTREHWGAAYMLQVRESRENLENKSLPAGLDESANRDRLSRIESRQQQIDRRIRNLEHQMSVLERESTVEDALETEIQKQFDLYNRQIKVIRKLQQKKEELQGNGKSDSEQELLQDDLNTRIETLTNRTEYWYEPLISLFSSEQVEKLREQLRFLVGEQLKLERQLKNVKKQKALTERLVEFSRTRKSYSTQLEPVLEELLALRRLKEEITYAKVKAKIGARNPDELADQLENRISAYNETNETSIEVPVLPESIPEDQREQRFPDLAGDLSDANTRTWAYQNWLASERREGRRLEGGVEVNAWQDRIAGLAARQAELQDSLTQLAGVVNEDTSSNTDGDSASEKGESGKNVSGEIGVTRDELRTSQLWATGRSIFFILIIPLFAFGILRAFDYTGELLLDRWKRRDEDKERLSNKEQREREERRKTLFQVLSAAFNITVIILAFIYLLQALNIDVTPLIASVGVLGLAVAFGAQPLFRDFFAGFFILLEDQYKMGDFVDIDGTEGTVERMNLRLTLLRARDGTLHYIPNGTIDQVSNRTKDWAKITMSVGVGYDDDIDHVISTLESIGEEMMEDEQFENRVNEVSVPGVDELAGSSVNIAFHLTVRPRERWQIAREVRRIIKLRFDEEGIDIPYKHVVVHND